MVNIIEIEDLSFNYSNIQIFDKLNLNIPKGSFITILGPNGSGKTTLLKLISGQINANTFIMIEDTPIIKENFKLVENDISFIEGNSPFFDKRKTVKQYLHNLNTNKVIINDIIKRLKLNRILNKEIYKLTSENKILLQFAKAIVKDPKIIIIDGVLEYLNMSNKKTIIKILNQLNNKGTTIINATNNQNDSIIGTHIAIIAEKNIIYGPTNAILENEDLFQYSNIELPFIVDLSHKLQFYNMIDKTYLDTEKLVEDLWN